MHPFSRVPVGLPILSQTLTRFATLFLGSWKATQHVIILAKPVGLIALMPPDSLFVEQSTADTRNRSFRASAALLHHYYIPASYRSIIYLTVPISYNVTAV